MNRLLGLVSVALLSACASMPRGSHSSDHAAINRVVDSFRTSIVEKDKERFLGLFLHDRITWQGVTDDADLERKRVKLPKATKAPINPKNTHITFIDGIVKDAKRNEETFDNIRIETDGNIASVYFDYVYLEDGRETNHGKESWLMVGASGGWKIVSVVWSEIKPAAQVGAAD